MTAQERYEAAKAEYERCEALFQERKTEIEAECPYWLQHDAKESARYATGAKDAWVELLDARAALDRDQVAAQVAA